MNLSRKLFFVLVITLFVATGCEFKDVEIERVEDIELYSLQGGNIDGTIYMVLNNPNSFDITVKSAQFEIFSGNVKLGEAELSKSFKIDAKDSKTYPIALSGNLKNALAGGFVGIAGLLTGQKPKVNIKGELKAGNFFVTKKFPIELETELPLDF